MTELMSTQTLTSDRWTRLNIILHWLIVVLISVQYLIGEWMAAFFDGRLQNQTLDGTTTTLAYLHIAIGSSILLAALLRLWDRFANGRPQRAKGEPSWAVSMAKVSHFLLYLIILAMPIAGLAALFLGNEWIGGLHELAAEVLLAILGIHVIGALANHFWFKTDVLRNMIPSRGRPSKQRKLGR